MISTAGLRVSRALEIREVNFGATRIGFTPGRRWSQFRRQPFFDNRHGDTVNIAARLEAANKFPRHRICVSATVAEGTENFKGRPVGD